MNPCREDASRLVGRLIGEAHIMNDGPVSRTDLDADLLFIILRNVQVHGHGLSGHPVYRKLSLHRFVLDLRVHRPDLVDTRFQGKRRERVSKSPVRIGVDLDVRSKPLTDITSFSGTAPRGCPVARSTARPEITMF